MLAFSSTAQEPARRVRVVVAPVIATFNPRWEYVDEDLVRAKAAETLELYLSAALGDAGYDAPGYDIVRANLKGLSIDFGQSRQRTRANLTALGQRHEAGYVALVVIEGFSQRNASPGTILNDLGKRQSETKSRVKVWLLDASSGKLLLDSKGYEGVAEGPFFGTTKRDELSGQPDAIGKMLEIENKRRALWIGRAACLAVNEAIGKWLGLRPPRF